MNFIKCICAYVSHRDIIPSGFNAYDYVFDRTWKRGQKLLKIEELLQTGIFQE